MTARTIRTGSAWTKPLAILAASTLALAACGQSDEPAAPDTGDDGETSAGDDVDGDGGDVELRFAWWGADLRHRLTDEVIQAFEAEHPGITVTGEFGDWSGYWDRLSTTAAAGDLPDVMQMDEKYILTYANQDSLLDLSTLDGLDTSEIDPAALPAGEVDGALYGLVTSINTYSFIGNADLLESAGADVPDDSAWTWDDLAQVSQTVTDGSDEARGLQYWGTDDGGLNIWARQQGESLWTEDGEVGVSADTLTEWWQYILDMSESGASSPPSVAQEQLAGGQAASGTATNRAAFGAWWSNQYAALSDASGQQLELLRPPMHEDAETRGTYYKPSMFWSASADTQHPEEVALFLDFLVNSTEAGEILLAERGVPSNLTVREHISDQLTEYDQVVVDFLAEVADEVDEAPPLTPEGASDIESRIQRYTSEVLFGSLTPAEAAEGLLAEIEEEVVAS